MQRINNLTIADLGANSPIYLNFCAERHHRRRHHHPRCQQQHHRFQLRSASQSIFEGQVVGGANGKLVKLGNGGLFFGNGTNTFGTAEFHRPRSLGFHPEHRHQPHRHHGARTGTPFGVGDINLTARHHDPPGRCLNIAGQKVTARQR
jgi:hypothetical protein